MLARIRGAAADEALFMRAAEFARANHIESDTDAAPLFDNPPPASDAEILKLLRQMYEAGSWVLVESAIADLPSDLRWLYESGAVTIEQLATIHCSIGATSAADLAEAAREHKLRALPGLDAAAEDAVAAAVPALRASIPRVPLGGASAVADVLLERLRAVPGVVWALPAGSLRRGQDTIGDIEIVVSTHRPVEASDEL